MFKKNTQNLSTIGPAGSVTPADLLLLEAHFNPQHNIVATLNGRVANIAARAAQLSARLPVDWQVDAVISTPRSTSDGLAEMTHAALSYYLEKPPVTRAGIALPIIPLRNKGGKQDWALLPHTHKHRLTKPGSNRAVTRLSAGNFEELVYRRTEEHPLTLTSALKDFGGAPIMFFPKFNYEKGRIQSLGSKKASQGFNIKEQQDAIEYHEAVEEMRTALHKERFASLLAAVQRSNYPDTKANTLIIFDSPGNLAFVNNHFNTEELNLGLALRESKQVAKYYSYVSGEHTKDWKVTERQKRKQPEVLTIDFSTLTEMLASESREKNTGSTTKRELPSLSRFLAAIDSVVFVWGVKSSQDFHTVKALGLLPIIPDEFSEKT